VFDAEPDEGAVNGAYSLVGGWAGSGEEQPERHRADVLRSHLGRSSGPNAGSNEREQRLDQGRNGDVAAKLAGRTP